MTPESERMPPYQKDPDAERILAAVNQRLVDLEKQLIARYVLPRYPTLFVVGAPRSGTTLLEQLLLTRFEFGYINNSVARFWMAPYVGAVLAWQISRGFRTPYVGVTSAFGATTGFDGPHEFGYFWQRWFRYGETHDIEDTDVQSGDRAVLGQELAAIESVFDRPLVLKNPVCSFHIGFLAETLPGSVFLHCRREPVYAAQSILQSRIKYHGDSSAWFSVKPAEYKHLRLLSTPEQVAGQIYFTRRAVVRQFRKLPAMRLLDVDYETLCDTPEAELDRIAAWVADNGHALRRRRTRLPKLSTTNQPSVGPEEFDALQRACKQRFSAGESDEERP